jgi:hypothetical protein
VPAVRDAILVAAVVCPAERRLLLEGVPDRLDPPHPAVPALWSVHPVPGGQAAPLLFRAMCKSGEATSNLAALRGMRRS